MENITDQHLKNAVMYGIKRTGQPTSETYKKIIGRALKTPCITRWNSTYDSVKELHSVTEELSTICESLGVPRFTNSNVEFLEEYQMCLSPIAFCLDKLQGENNMYLGDVLPWLFGLKENLFQVGLVSSLIDVYMH